MVTMVVMKTKNKVLYFHLLLY